MTQSLQILQPTHLQLFTDSFIPAGKQRGHGGAAVRPLLVCNGALAALQQGCRCTTKAAPSQTNKGLTAEKRRLFRTKSVSKNLAKSSFRKSRKALPAYRHFKNPAAGGHRPGPTGPLRHQKHDENEQKRDFLHTEFCKNLRWVIRNNKVGSRLVATASVPRRQPHNHQ